MLGIYPLRCTSLSAFDRDCSISAGCTCCKRQGQRFSDRGYLLAAGMQEAAEESGLCHRKFDSALETRGLSLQSLQAVRESLGMGKG